MAVVRFYQGRPVKRMRVVPNGIRLIFVSTVAGQPGEQATITQAEWDKHGDKKFVPDEDASADALRKVAAKATR